MKNKHFVILNITLFFLVLIILQHKEFTSYYSVHDDARYFFFINNFPDNLKDNLLAQYAYSKGPATIYLSTFYIFFNKSIDFIYLTKFMSVFTFLISVIFIYKLGMSLKSKKYALILTFLFLLRPWIYWPFSGGLSRSFAFPLLIAFLYYFIMRDILKLSFVLLLEAMIYPPIFLVSLLMYGISLIDIKGKRINLALNKNYLFYVFAVISFILILVPMIFFNYGIKEQITLKEAISSPDFYEGGISGYPVFAGSIPFTSDAKSTIRTLIQVYNFGINKPIYANGLFILIVLSSIFIITYRKQIFRLPKEVYLLLLSSLILQSLAFLLFPKLFMPSRYVFTPIPLFLMIIFANGMYLLSMQKRFKHIFILLILALLVFYVAKLIATPANIVYCADKGVYDYLKSLPKDSLIAGFPTDMNCIALFGQRNPFVMSILNAPFYKDYYKAVKQHEFDFFSAYYGNKQDVQNFCKKSGVTHIVINKDFFDKKFLSQEHYYSEPFEPFETLAYIKNITKGKNEFYLQKPENIVYESGNKVVIRCDNK